MPTVNSPLQKIKINTTSPK